MKLYYNLTNQCRVDEDNCRLTSLPVVYYGTAPIWELQLYQGELGTGPDVADVSGLTAWRAAIDTDWNSSTDPMCRTVEGIDFSKAADGLLKIPLNANTITFANVLNGKKSLNGFFELRGFTTQGAVESIILFGVTLHNAIDPEGGAAPESVLPDTITRAEVMACLRAPDERQYTSDPADSSAIHSSQTDSDTYTRRRNSAAAGDWGPWEALIQGPQGPMPVISAGSAVSVPPEDDLTIDIVPVSGGYQLDFQIPAGVDGVDGEDGQDGEDGISPLVSVTQLEGGVELYTSDANGETSGFISNGSLTMPIKPYSSDSAYNALTCIAYNGGGYQVISATSAGENPDNAAFKFICFASKGTDGTDGDDGISPTLTISETGSGVQIIASDAQGTSSGFVSNGSNGLSPITSVTQISSGAIVYTSDAQGETSALILNGQLEGASEQVTSLTSGGIVLAHEAVPVALLTSAGNMYYVEKGTITISSGAWVIDPAAYLAYDGVSAFAGPWTVYYAGGLPEFQLIHGGSSSFVPYEHQVYQVPLSSGTSITVDSSGLTSAVCMTAELWLDMPSPAVSFTLPAFTWTNGSTPDFTSGSTRYVVVARWNGTKFLANLAYTEALT